LKNEFLLNDNEYLEIRKVWDCSKGKLTASSLKTYLICKYPSQFSKKPLPTLKIDELRKVLESEDIAFAIFEKQNNNQLENLDTGLEIGPFDPDTDKVVPVEFDKRKRAEIRKAIYSVSDTSQLSLIEMPLDKEDCKNIWESLSKDLPWFFLFQVDRLNKDSDKEVQDPLKVITKRAIENVTDKLEEVTNLIKESAEKIGVETIEKLKEMNPELAKVLRPDVSTKAWDSLFSFSFIGDDNIPMNKRGSGFRRLITLNYFRAEAERKNKENKNIIYAIEEPETSQHPDHQKLLVSALSELAHKENYQVIITTHSPEIAKQLKDENLILIDKKDNENYVVKDNMKLKAISETLGLSSYIGKLVVCVEGQNDINFLMNINQNIDVFKNIIDLKNQKIKIIPMNGSSLINWVEKNYLEGSNVIEFHLYDRDSDEKYKESVGKVNQRTDSSKGILTIKREMENYIPSRLYESEFEIDLSDISDWDNSDIGRIVTDRNKKFDEEKVVKCIINGKLTKLITKQDLLDLNCFEEVENWFIEIKNLFEK
jgi:putative ATP-dependent endonuclease of the OLD family